MTPLKSLTFFGIGLTSLFLLSCDGGTSSNSNIDEQALLDVDPYGLDTTDPTATASFPKSLVSGDSITFTQTTPAVLDGVIILDDDFFFNDDDLEAGQSFIEEVPLGTWTVDSSGFVRQDSGSTGDLYFPVSETTFKHIYGSTSDTSAFVEYSFEHRFTRIEDFVPRLNFIFSSSSEPNSLQDAITTAGLVAERSRVIVDAVSDAGIAAVRHPSLGNAVRMFRQIRFGNITSTNTELTGDTPTITGTYTLTDTWAVIDTTDSEAPVTLAHSHNGNGDHLSTETVDEVSAGTFTIQLNSL